MTALNFPSSPSNGDVYENYVYDSTTGVWKRLPPGGEINGLDDVVVTSPSDGDSLVYNGTEWVNSPGSSNVASDAIQPNSNQITEDYTFEANKNGVSAGPITIASGVTVTIGATSAWSIV